MKYFVRIRTNTGLQAGSVESYIRNVMKYNNRRYYEGFSIKVEDIEPNKKPYVMYYKMEKEEIEEIKNSEILEDIGSIYYATTKKELIAIANSMYRRGKIM